MSVNGLNPAQLVQQLQSEETSAVKNKNKLAQDDFLKLLITQLKHQDPTNPQDGGKFLSDMAQFSTVEGINQMNGTLGSLVTSLRSQQALFASSLVGRNVLVDKPVGLLKTGESIQGSVDLPLATKDLSLQIFDVQGKVVKEIVVGRAEEGAHAFSWNGVGDDNKIYPPGEYLILAKATIGNQVAPLHVAIMDQVQSVTVESDNQFSLNLTHQGVVPFNQIKRIG